MEAPLRRGDIPHNGMHKFGGENLHYYYWKDERNTVKSGS
jgi:hypothetical protein